MCNCLKKQCFEVVFSICGWLLAFDVECICQQVGFCLRVKFVEYCREIVWIDECLAGFPIEHVFFFFSGIRRNSVPSGQ